MISRQTASEITDLYNQIAVVQAMLDDPKRLVLSDNFNRRTIHAPADMVRPLLTHIIELRQQELASLCAKAAAELRGKE